MKLSLSLQINNFRLEVHKLLYESHLDPKTYNLLYNVLTFMIL